MILQQILKQIVIAVAVLAYFQGFSCSVEKDELMSMQAYWNKKIEWLKEEVSNRKHLLDRLEDLVARTTLFYAFIEDIEIKRVALFNVETAIATLCKSTQYIREEVDGLKNLRNNRQPDDVIEYVHTKAINLLPKHLDESDAVSKEMQTFDSSMLILLEGYIGDINRKICNSVLFSLAKKNCSLAINIVYAFFSIAPCGGDNLEDRLFYIYEKVEKYGFKTNLIHYSDAIRKEAKGQAIDLLKTANTYLHILFNTIEVCREEIYAYLELTEENLTAEKINKHSNLSPAAIIKIIMIEYEINIGGCLMNYRKNVLFSNLGKIIQNVYDNGTKEQQNKILDALSMLWSKCEEQERNERVEKIIKFCRDNSIQYLDFVNMKYSLMTTSWMFNIDKTKPTNPANGQEIANKACIDITYTHPLFYLYKRCERISHSVKQNQSLQDKPFIREESSGDVRLRLYKISEKDSEAVQTENIQSCVRLWFSNGTHVKIFFKSEEKDDYKSIARDFRKYFNESRYTTSDTAIKEE
ncbi:hypothetical protein NEMIN01_1006 [Nematocida minor]|uniref:uncharacterized protein n=1 Tax=Nematocida minor TaxID=1912983 RepID=UPI0022200F1F|nr:uncharacterized protein NEMIN01_1006 [Nematocida minor]KAI5190382.1 hypothetical protein NEMIN01_1006 [Nematocida minor]